MTKKELLDLLKGVPLNTELYFEGQDPEDAHDRIVSRLAFYSPKTYVKKETKESVLVLSTGRCLGQTLSDGYTTFYEKHYFEKLEKEERLINSLLKNTRFTWEKGKIKVPPVFLSIAGGMITYQFDENERIRVIFDEPDNKPTYFPVSKLAETLENRWQNLKTYYLQKANETN